MSMRSLVVPLFAVSVFVGCSTSTTESPLQTTKAEAMTNEVVYATDSLDTVKRRVAAGEAILLDVRSEEEWNDSHLTMAEFIPTSIICDAESCGPAVSRLDKDKDIYIHCKIGGRAMRCGEVLAARGYKALPLRVNYEEFAKAGFQTAGRE